MHLGRALHAVIKAGHGEAALIAEQLFFAVPGDFRVDQHHGLIAIFRHVDHDDAFVHIHLRRSQADAIGVIHGCEHVVEHSAYAVVHGFNRLGDLVQAWVGITKNRKNCHVQRGNMSLFSPLLSIPAAGGRNNHCSIKGLG